MPWAFRMPYVPPHARLSAKVVPVPQHLDTSSDALFPALSSSGVTCARTIHETSLASRAAAWNEALTMKSSNSEERLREEAIEDAKEALRIFYNSRPREKEYVRADDVYQDRLDELESMEALEYNEAHPEEEKVSIAEEWTTKNRAAPRTRPTQVKPVVTTPEFNPTEIRERITMLEKRLRRNGILREDKEAHEKELRELYKLMYDSD